MQVLSLSGSLPAAPGSAPWKARLAAEPPKNCVRESGESREHGPTLSPGAGSSALRWPAVTQAERSGARLGLAAGICSGSFQLTLQRDRGRRAQWSVRKWPPLDSTPFVHPPVPEAQKAMQSRALCGHVTSGVWTNTDLQNCCCHQRHFSFFS